MHLAGGGIAGSPYCRSREYKELSFSQIQQVDRHKTKMSGNGGSTDAAAAGRATDAAVAAPAVLKAPADAYLAGTEDPLVSAERARAVDKTDEVTARKMPATAAPEPAGHPQARTTVRGALLPSLQTERPPASIPWHGCGVLHCRVPGELVCCSMSRRAVPQQQAA